VRHQYRLNSVELQEWAAAHGYRISSELFASEGAAGPSLAEALERGGIHAGVGGASREEVIAAISELPGIPAHVDREMLRQLLLAREALGCTAFGNGIAIPHPRDPLVLGLREPSALLCFLAHGVDFNAADGQPVGALFLLLSPSVRGHLQMLASVARALKDPTLLELVKTQAPPKAILDRLRALEPAEERA
jgi:PTS system nitrogen regulatory IIA component